MEEAENGANESDSDEEMLVEESLKDPRAGAVHVTLPQLNPDFTKLSEFLFKIGSDKSTSQSKRNLLYDLTKQFKNLSENIYPLMPDMSEEEAKIPKIKPGQVAKRKAKQELEILEKMQKEREDYKKALKRKRAGLEIEDTENGENNETAEDAMEESGKILLVISFS